MSTTIYLGNEYQARPGMKRTHYECTRRDAEEPTVFDQGQCSDFEQDNGTGQRDYWDLNEF